MSYTTITQSTRDEALQDRVTAAAMKEAIAGAVAGTEFAIQLSRGPHLALIYFMWPVAVDYEAEYEYAVSADPPNPNPGGDPGVITDANIGSAIQTHWPVTP